MNKCIIYTDESGRKILTPCEDARMDEELDKDFAIRIAEKDVPAGIPYTIVDASEIQVEITELREQKWAKIKAERDQLEQAGVPYLGKTIDSDTVSIQRIAIAVQAAQAAIAADQPFTLAWTMQDNTAVEMDAAQVIGMSVALAQYSDSLHQTARGLREQIEAAETAEELEVIEWPE